MQRLAVNFCCLSKIFNEADMSTFCLNLVVGYFIVLTLLMSMCNPGEGVPNPSAASPPIWQRGCESLQVIPDLLGDEEQLRCCEGWKVLNGKCVRDTQPVRQRCKKVTCPEGMVCSPYINNLCVCPRGRTGFSCEDDCESGYYGLGCRQRCTCPEGDSCNKITGDCDNDGDAENDHDIASTTMINQASNKTAGFCGSGCGLRGAIGCVCNGDSNRCECPGYAVALVVVSVLTWVTVGGVFAGYYIKRNGYVEPLLERYRRKLNYDEEGDDSGFNTDVDQAPVLIPWCDFPPPISQRNSGEYPLLTPLAVPNLVGLSSYFTRISRDSLPRSTSHSSEDENGDDDEDDDRHDYLNVTEIKTDPDSDGEEYSQPYEHLDNLSRQGSVHSHYAVNREDCLDSSFMIRTWTETEDMRHGENSYVNESVLKWKRRFATKRAFLSRQNRSLAKTRNIVAPLSSSCSDVPSIASSNKHKQRLAIDSAQRKPTVKPKPEFIKLKMMMDIEKRKRSFSRTRAVKSCDSVPPHQCDSISLSDINSSKEYEIDDPNEMSQSERTRNKRIRFLRAALLKKGLSVPNSVPQKDRDILITSEDEDMNMENYEGDYDAIYENECVLKSARQSRLNSLHQDVADQ